MFREKFIGVISIVFLAISPGLLHSQRKYFTLFDVLPGPDHTVIIAWRMTPEIDSLPLEVERSRDKSTWEKIAFVPPDSSHQYSKVDLQPGEGLIYYRVRQLSSRDRSLYAGVRWVQLNEAGKLYIWPNPAKTVLHVKTPFLKGSIDIVDPAGKHILKITITDLITDVPTTRLSKGPYFLHVKHEDKIVVEKFIRD